MSLYFQRLHLVTFMASTVSLSFRSLQKFPHIHHYRRSVKKRLGFSAARTLHCISAKGKAGLCQVRQNSLKFSIYLQSRLASTSAGVDSIVKLNVYEKEGEVYPH